MIFLKITLILLNCAFFFLLVRLFKGPTTADRVVAIDLIAVTSVGFLLLISLMTNEPIYIDIAIALAFVGFLTTVSCSRFILYEGKNGDNRNH